jgi:NTE family protein
MDILQNRSRLVRKRQIVDSFKLGVKEGAYWGVQAEIESFGVPGALTCPRERTDELARLPSRLKEMPDDLQERLINWGYAVCDAAMRKHVVPDASPPADFPYPARGV